jgi:hypothetical protein
MKQALDHIHDTVSGDYYKDSANNLASMSADGEGIREVLSFIVKSNNLLVRWHATLNELL